MKTLISSFLLCILALACKRPAGPAAFTGDWLDPKTNEWVLGIRDHKVFFGGRIYRYDQFRGTPNRVEATLTGGARTRRLYLRTLPHGIIEMTIDGGTTRQVTRKRNPRPEYGNYERTGFGRPRLRLKNYTVSGFLREYRHIPDTPQYVKVIFNQLADGSQKEYLGAVRPDGTFSLTFPLLNPQEIMLRFNSLCTFYAIPGNSVLLSIGKKAQGLRLPQPQNVLYMGTDGMLNTEINDFAYRLFAMMDLKTYFDNLGRMDQEQYLAYRLGVMDRQLNMLGRYARERHSGAAFREIMTQQVTYEAGNDLLRYRWERPSAKIKLERAYLRFTDRIPVDNPAAVITDRYGDFLDEWYKLRKEDPELAQAGAGMLSGNELSADLLRALSVTEQIEDGRLGITGVNDHLEAITDAGIRSSVRLKAEELVKLRRMSGTTSGTVHTRAENIIFSDQQKLMASLTGSYKGSVIYIDFWAPWCVPCMGEMPASKALQKRFSGKKVVFLNLGVSCTEASWRSTIAAYQLTGQHYLLKDREFDLLSTRFQIDGIPRFMLIDKKGNIVLSNAPPPSDRKTETYIRRLLDSSF